MHTNTRYIHDEHIQCTQYPFERTLGMCVRLCLINVALSTKSLLRHLNQQTKQHLPDDKHYHKLL